MNVPHVDRISMVFTEWRRARRQGMRPDAAGRAALGAPNGALGAAPLFIDDRADQAVTCHHLTASGTVDRTTGQALGSKGMCWQWSTFRCEPCDRAKLIQECGSRFPDYCNATTPCTVRSETD